MNSPTCDNCRYIDECPYLLHDDYCGLDYWESDDNYEKPNPSSQAD